MFACVFSAIISLTCTIARCVEGVGGGECLCGDYSLCGPRKYPYSHHRGSLEIPRARGSQRPKFFKESISLNSNFQRGRARGRFKLKNNPLWGKCGYFLEQHIKVLYGEAPT